MSNFTRIMIRYTFHIGKEDDAILILTFFDYAMFCFTIFFPFLHHFSRNFIKMFPLNLARHFRGIN